MGTGFLSVCSYPARRFAANRARIPLQTRVPACKPLSRAPCFGDLYSQNLTKNRLCGRSAALRAGRLKKGRPDGWLYVGGTKAGPAVLWLYPFGGAPNGHHAGGQLDPIGCWRKGPEGGKIVMECRGICPPQEAVTIPPHPQPAVRPGRSPWRRPDRIYWFGPQPRMPCPGLISRQSCC